MISNTRILLLYFILFLSSNFLKAQDRSNYGLLWEIEHKNSDKKSYLFGTLHVKDNRAFQFSDSVIPAIKKSEVFALEINPDSVYNNFNENYYSINSENIFKKILSKQDYQKLKDRFFAINEIDLDSFPNMHPKLIESMLVKEKNKSDDRRTFLDAYLYGLAYNEEKEITGLERLEDQMPLQKNLNHKNLKEKILNILDTSNEEQDGQLEKITQLYYEGDINNIWDYINEFDQDNDIMVKRNHVMANSIEDIMQHKTVFAAVGTAHLPGKDGVLDLLQKKGYKVRQVKGTFTQEYNQYSMVPNTARWVLNREESLGYSVLTPTKPVPIDIDGKFKTLTSTDLIFGGAFAYMAMDLRLESLKEDFDIIGNIIKSQLKRSTDSVLMKKTFKKDSIEFTEVLIQKEKNVSRLQIAFANKIVYSFFTESSLEEITSPYANAFFNSISVFKPKFAPSNWQNKTDTLGAYSIQIPEVEKIRNSNRENPNGEETSPYVLNIFSSEDKAENTVYVFRYNDQPLGYYLNQKEDYYSYFETYFKEQGTFLKETESITINGVEGKEYELMFSDKYHTRARLFLRGNRTYLLMAQKFKEEEKILEDDEFINSFNFIPYAKAAFDTIVNINEQYSFKPPSKQLIINEEPQDASSEYNFIKNYSSIDVATGGTYLVQHTQLKPYHRNKSIQNFYDTYVDILTEYNDTVISNIPITWAGKSAREIKIENPSTHVKQNIRLLLDDDTLLIFLTYLGKEELNDTRVATFFNSLKINNNSKNFDLSASKADLIFKHLKSKDSSQVLTAQGALHYYEFDTSEYNSLKKSLKHHYSDDSIYYGTKYFLIKALVELENKETLKTLRDFYKDKNASHNARLEVLTKLLELKNSEAAATYLDFLENHKPERRQGEPYKFINKLADTIPLFVANDALFSKLADTDDYRDQIASLYTYNILDDSLYADKMPLLKNKLISHMHRDSKQYLDTVTRQKSNHLTYSLLSSYIDIAKETGSNNPEVVKTLTLLSENLKNEQWLKSEALIASAKLNIDINPKTISDAFENLYTRFNLMESLVNSEKTELIPKEYLEPVEIAKLALYTTLENQYDEYTEIFNFLGQTTIQNKNYYAFTFSVTEDEENYLGLAEEVPINFSDFKMANAYVDWELVEEDWETQAANFIKKETTSEKETVE